MNIPDKYKPVVLRLITRISEWSEFSLSIYSKILRFLKERKVYGFFISLPLLILLSYNLMLILTPAFHNVMVSISPVRQSDTIRMGSGAKADQLLKSTENRIRNLDKSLSKFKNLQSYLIVNTTRNEFKLFNRGKLVRSGMCSTGSYILLDAGDEKKWKFETPKGLFRIQGKTESPVWKKPDWAFIEEGLPVPPTQSHLRYEYGVLGDYALSIGDGYLIHGTLYKRLLGMPVTHGCVRLNDEDLEAVFNTLWVGSKVYIF